MPRPTPEVEVWCRSSVISVTSVGEDVHTPAAPTEATQYGDRAIGNRVELQQVAVVLRVKAEASQLVCSGESA